MLGLEHAQSTSTQFSLVLIRCSLSVVANLKVPIATATATATATTQPEISEACRKLLILPACGKLSTSRDKSVGFVRR